MTSRVLVHIGRAWRCERDRGSYWGPMKFLFDNSVLPIVEDNQRLFGRVGATSSRKGSVHSVLVVRFTVSNLSSVSYSVAEIRPV